MTHTITATNGAGTTSPLAVEKYSAERSSRNVIHDLLDGSLGVSFVTPRPRSGVLSLVYQTRAEAWAGFNLHSAPSSFQYLSSEVPEIGMRYVIDGSGIRVDQHDVTGLWIVTVGFQEVSV